MAPFWMETEKKLKDIILKNGDMYIPSQGCERFEPNGKVYGLSSPVPSEITRVYVNDERLEEDEYSYASGVVTLTEEPNGEVRVHWETGEEEFDSVIGESISQRINVRLRWFLNESVFYPDYGVDYYGEILTKNPNKNRIISMISKIIRETDGVISVEDVSVEINNRERSVKIEYTAKTTQGLIEEDVALWLTE